MEIRLNQITKSFGGRVVIPPTDLTFASGDLTTLLGPSGCGKTTLLRMIAGLETPDSGSIFFDDQVIFSAQEGINLPPEKRGLGFVFQDFALWPHMKVFDNVAFGLRATRKTENLEAKVMEALRSVQLEDYADRYPHQLSGGQQQRVAFARAMVIEPKCVLFDEPLSALDARLREEMRQEVRELVTRLGITAVFVTHDQAEAMSISDRIAVLCQGRVERFGTPEEIYFAPGTVFTAKFVGDSNWLDKTHMFRPEKASFTPTPGATEFRARVSAVQFQGSAYQTRLSYGQGSWLVTGQEKMQVGAEVSIYIQSQDIIQMKETRETK